MLKLRRIAASVALVLAPLALLGAPAQAAPGDVEVNVFLRNLTLPADGAEVEEDLSFLLFADRPGWADEVTLSVDLSEVAVADVEVSATAPGAECSGDPVVRCVVPGPHEVFQHPGDGSSVFLTMTSVLMTLTPKPVASVGDSGTLTIATKADDGPATTETATIRIGEGVNLTAVDDGSESVAPGGDVTLRPRVRNSGSTVVDGLIAVINADDEALADTDFGNCTYGYSVTCEFDTTLAAGDTYRISEPFTLRAPRDAAAGSQTVLSVQWLTAAEWEDWEADYGDLPGDRPGTGPDLELDEVSASAAGAPQADTDHDDNGSYTTVTVTGDRRTDLIAVGASLTDAPGDVQTIRVGLDNRGPGTLRYPPFVNNLPTVLVTLPAGVSVVTADERCRSLSEDFPVPPEYYCMPRPLALRPGQRLTFTFAVRAARATRAAEGSVELSLLDAEDSIDRDPRNNRAPITLSVADNGGGGGGLPVTGTPAAKYATAGILLVLAGVALIAGRRRRPGLRQDP